MSEENENCEGCDAELTKQNRYDNYCCIFCCNSYHLSPPRNNFPYQPTEASSNEILRAMAAMMNVLLESLKP